jgi:cell division protein FtsA
MQVSGKPEDNLPNENPIVVGLDIGTTKIACIVAQRDRFGKLRILGMGRSDSNGGVQRGEVFNIQTTTEAIKKAVEEAQKSSGVEIKVVYVGIAGQHISSRQNRGIYTLPEPDSEIKDQYVKDMIDDMYKLALEPGERIIHVLPQEFIVDNHMKTKQPVGMFGSRLEADFHIITGKIAAVNNIKRCVERAGLQMLGLILEPLASSASVLKDEEIEAGVALVDIGGGTTDIAIFEDGIIRHTAVIPFAGDIITQDIKNECQVLRSQAEKLKIRFGCAIATETHDHEIIAIPGIAGREKKDISMRTLASIIQSRVEEIFSAVSFEIRNSGLQNQLIAGIVLTGGGSQLMHLKQLVEYVTGYSTRIGYPTEHIAKGTKEELKNPMYATGIGLILKGYEVLEEEKIRENKKKTPTAQLKPSTPEVLSLTPPIEKSTRRVKEERWWTKLNRDIKEWFTDTDVNEDFK